MNVASKSAQFEAEKAEVIEEALDALDQLLDRVKVLYEQYFLGIQKQPPQHLHTDVERKLRDLAQLQIRNTALRYRFATVQQKFGAYNTYWRRTLREIDAGRYHRSLSRVTRRAAATGAEIPHEILAAMPQRMRDQVRRDREAAVALQRHRESAAAEAARREAAPLAYDGDADDDDDGGEGFVRESTEVRERALRAREALHVIDEADAEIDMDSLLDAFVDEEPAAAPPTSAAARSTPAATFQASPPSGPPPAQQVAPPISVAPPMRAASMGAPVRPGGPGLAAIGVGAPWPPAEAPVASAAAASPQAEPAAAERPKSGPSLSGRPPAPTPPIPAPALPKLPPIAPSQQTRPTPIVPGASRAMRPATADELTGPFPRAPMGSPPKPKPPAPNAAPPKPPPTTITIPPRAAGPGHPPEPTPRPAVPPGMSDSDVNALYDRYVEAKRQIGQAPNPSSFNKLMKTIHAQTPKIMEQYRAKAVDYSIAIKDNQVIIRAKPKL